MDKYDDRHQAFSNIYKAMTPEEQQLYMGNYLSSVFEVDGIAWQKGVYILLLR